LSSRRRLVAVCGESDPQTSLRDLAFELGRGIAQRHAVLLCGGLTVGIKTWRFDRQGRTEPELPVVANPTEALDWLFAHMGRRS
jgi:hypothetical protein